MSQEKKHENACKVEKIHLNTNPNQLDNPILNKHHGFLLAGPSGARFGPTGPWNHVSGRGGNHLEMLKVKGVVNQLMKRVTPTGGDFSCEFAGKWPKHSGFSGFLLNWPNIFRVEGLGVPGWANSDSSGSSDILYTSFFWL